MKKYLLTVASLLMALTILATTLSGCTSNSTSTSTTTSPTTTTTTPTTQTITDMDGRTVIIPAPALLHNVAVLTSPQIIDMYVIGEQSKLCAVTNAVKQWSLLKEIDPRISSIPAVRSSAAQINIEALLQSNPDLCIGSQTDMQVVEKSTSIPCLEIATNQTGNFIQAQIDEVTFFGKVFGQQAKAAKYAAYLNNTTSSVTSALTGLTQNQRLKVYMGLNADHLTTYGGATYMDEWMGTAGCANAAHSVTATSASEGGLSTVSPEQILNWNPDIILLDTGKPADLYNDPTWSKISAVQNKKVYVLPVGMFLWDRPSPEAAAMLPKWLSLTAYPDRFKNTDMPTELKKFYSDIFGYTMTDADVKTILGQ